MDKEHERLVDVIMYLACLSMSAIRLAKNLNPFDFESLATAEFITARTLPFIENEECDYREAHKDFIQSMVENGWKQGQEDFANRVHPDLVSWEDLPKESRDHYGYTAGLVSGAKEFYTSLKADLEVEFMDSIPSLAIKGKLIIPGSIQSQRSTH